MATAIMTVALELPEGVTVNTDEYRASHGTPVNVYGRWVFEKAGGGVQFIGPGTLMDLIDQLPEGDWMLMP
jgi:hypothetical protein